jgi:hypothetical protein
MRKPKSSFDTRGGERLCAGFLRSDCVRLQNGREPADGNPQLACERPRHATFQRFRDLKTFSEVSVNLQTHFDQDGFGPDVLICYAIMPLYDMDANTGATAISPGSHLKVQEINQCECACGTACGRVDLDQATDFDFGVQMF